MGGKRQLTHEEFMRKVIETNEHVRCGDLEVLGTYTKSSGKIECICHKHNITWFPYADSLYKGIGCRKCGAEKTSRFQRKTHDEFVKELHELDNSIRVLSTYTRSNDDITIQFKCGHILTTKPNNILTNHQNCPYCSGQAVLRGFNDLWTVNPELAKLLANPEDGYKLTRMSGQKVTFRCPECGHLQDRYVSNIAKRGWSCKKCGDSISYPAKFMRAVLDMLEVDNYDVEWQPDWAKPYLYDFHIHLNDKDYIIEVDGGFHYLETTQSNLSLEERKKIDAIKDKLAIDNNAIMIRIDANKSDCNYIKNNILNSGLVNMFDLSSLDWNECNKKAQKSLVKIVCDYYMKTHFKSKDIAKHFKLASTTVVNYLKRGAEIGWCDYDPKKNHGHVFVSIPILAFDTITEEAYEFRSILKCRNTLKEKYGLTLHHEQIIDACKNKEPYKGFLFELSNQTIQN